ncbi:hypothetical protein B194_4716 [Serratia plymuthica A30]|nr:hypothetical protein [Serratia plymuthica]EKF62436.1 hypothetical protein B194_4716 [Serratia plymuthica A30]MBI6138089.1 hypothetical protein [Serratia plymuthica]NIC27063.1 hypothetical protein [Serratia plymuthica]
MKSIIEMLKAKKNTVQPQQRVTNKNQTRGAGMGNSNNNGHCQGGGGW